MTLISVTKAAELLGVGRTTVYRLVKEGRIPCVKTFGPLRVHAERLQAMIDAEAEASIENQKAEGANGNSKSHQVRSRTQPQAERELDRLLQRSTNGKASTER